MLDITKLSIKEIYKLAEDENTPTDILALLSVNFKSRLRKEIKDPWIRAVVTHDDIVIREKIASNKKTSLKILRQLLLDPNPLVRNKAAENPNTPAEILQQFNNAEKIQFLSLYHSVKNKAGWLNFCTNNNLLDINLPANLEFPIFDDFPQAVITLIIRGFDLSSKAQEELANYKGKNQAHIRMQLAQNKSISPQILAKLARDPAKKVREAVAKNIKTPTINLIVLAGDINLRVRKAVTKHTIKNSQVSVELLEYLATDSNWLVRKKVANQSHTPTHILEKLTEDSCEYVRLGVAQNCNCPVTILEQLKHDSSKYVRLAVVKRFY